MNVYEYLEQLNKEVTALEKKVNSARKACTRAEAATSRAEVALLRSPEDAQLKLLHDQAKRAERQALELREKLEKEKEQLQGERCALAVKLPSGGERTLPSE